jgi:hypothetical protein
MINIFGKTTASAFGLIRQMALNSSENTLTVSQDYIAKVTKTNKGQYGKGFKELEKWKFIKVTRNSYGNIKKYKVFETNFQIFIHFPEFYKENMNKENMEYLFTKMKTKTFVDTELALDLVENANKGTEFDISVIKKNIKKLEKRHLGILNKSTLPREGECGSENEPNGSGPTLPREGAVHIDKNNNVLKHPSDVESLSSKANGARSKLNRRKIKKPKQSKREALRGDFAKRENKKPTSAKRKGIDSYYSTRNFIQVKRHWNSLPGLKKISDLKEKQNKTLDTSILAVQALLSGRLFKSGITLDGGWKRELILSGKTNPGIEDISVSWLLEKITIFHKIVTDKALYPSNKQHISKLTLGDFILGTERGQYEFPSSLFELCCGELKTAWKDSNPKLTSKIGKAYNEYTEQDRDFSGFDLKHFSELGTKIISFSESSDAKRSFRMKYGDPNTIVGIFFATLLQEWRGRLTEQSPKYFAGEHAWETFLRKVEY